MNVGPRSTMNKIVQHRNISEVQIKVLIEPMNNLLGVSPSEGYQGATRGKEKIFFFSLPRVAP